jgi:hypothetical protein
VRALIVATGYDGVERVLKKIYDTAADAQIAIIELEAEDQGC